jgi:hypothetical protein
MQYKPTINTFPKFIFRILNFGVLYMFRWFIFRNAVVQGDQKVSVHLMITVQNTLKIFLNSINHLP